jgi:glutamate racemase
MASDLPIGIFDSGVGGTSIWKEIEGLLPYENTIYLADSKNAPYGNRSVDEIISLCVKNTKLLLDLNCKIIVVACNTATTNAISYLRKNYDVPFIGIEPAIKPAALMTNSNSIGILATRGTLNSQLFSSTSKEHTQGIKITEVIGEGLVQLIEQGKIDSTEMTDLLKKYLKPMLDEGIDHIVLGCSHYPYLMPILKDLLSERIQIIDSGEAVARQTKNILDQNQLLRTEKGSPYHRFYSNSTTKVILELLKDHANIIHVEQKDF